MPLKKKKYNARFPAGRIKKIMQTDEEVGKVAQAVPVIISRTLEMFVESLLTKSLQVTLSRNAKTLSPSHLKQCILAESRFDFLRDLVKNIPDVSPAEEKEASQNWSAENSPNTCRYNEVKKYKLPSHTSVTSQNNNAHSSDSSSDSELSAKNKIGLPGNGRYPGLRTHDEERSAIVPPPVPVRSSNPVPSITSSAVIPQPYTSQNFNVSHHRLPTRPSNFYQETLRDEDDKRESPPIYSSVIQPNPEYSGATTAKQTTHFKKTQPPEQPKLCIDLSKGLSKDVDVLPGSTSVKPVFHIDLSAMPLTPSTPSIGSPFTPTLLRQPHTPLITEANPLKLNSDITYRSALHRSDSFNQYRKGPPPLQTLKRATSFENTRTPANAHSQQPIDVSMPQIKIEMNANDGLSPRFHLDLSNYKFGTASSPTPLTPKKRKIAPNEPPALLPITPTQKSPVNLSKNSTASMQLDEDYDA